MYFAYLIFTLCSLVFLIFLPSLKNFLRTWHLSKKFPGPKPLPLLGNASLFFGCQPEDVFNIIKNIMLEYGDTIKFWFGLQFSIFMANTKDLEVILGTTTWLTKSFEYGLLANWLCEGLLLSKPAKWFKRRKILTPAFHFKILEQFVDVFERNSRFLI
ncbi:cytochrome P450 4d10-like [Haematobia irritans]|uniref:cytochrome P450 4d10-like n=1 Tax=Haematobia irritans TaxID=7368 RepID=UPI003F50868E